MDWSSSKGNSNETKIDRSCTDIDVASMDKLTVEQAIDTEWNGGHVSMKIVACAVPNPTTISLELETGGQSSPEIGPCRGCIFKLFLRDDLRQLRGTLYLFWWFDLRLCAGPRVGLDEYPYSLAREMEITKWFLEEQDATNIFSSFVRKLEITNHEY